jgi:SAM-dependent methyltransferase
MAGKGVERYHDRVAGKYDAMYRGSAYWDFYDAITWEHLKRFLPTDLASPCVDLGCGTGKWGLKLARTGFPVTLVDISAAMLEQARRAAEELPESKRPQYVKADLADLSALPQAHFAFAVAQGDPLSLVENPAAAIRGIFDILRPGGVLIASVDNRPAGLRHFLEKGDLDGLEGFVRSGRTKWLTSDKAEQFPVKMFFPQELRDLLTKAGFEVLDVIGKTVLDLRRYGRLLEDPAAVRRLIALESRLHRMEACLGLASHIQTAARKPA